MSSEDGEGWSTVILAFSIAIGFALLPFLIILIFLGLDRAVHEASGFLLNWSYLGGIISGFVISALMLIYRKNKPKRLINRFLRH